MYHYSISSPKNTSFCNISPLFLPEYYYHSSIDTMSILDNNVTSIASTTRGELYIGCSKGLMKYDYSMDHFIRLRFPDGIQPRVTSLFECPDGVLLISTAGYGIAEAFHKGIGR